MTCTIGFIDGRIVIIASDSAATSENAYTLRRKNSKIWSDRHLIFGFAGDFAVCQWIRYVFIWPEFSESGNHEQSYLVKCSHGIEKGLKERFPDTPQASLKDWQLMIGLNGRLFVMYSNGDVEESIENFAAIGSGASIALGSLHATKILNAKLPDKLTSWDHIQLALEASAANDVNIKRPFNVIHSLF
jgi:ATP-dependent protease HslVU (ClpYQ) peptidase subunit